MGAHWYFDFVSPFSYLHWQKVRPLVEALLQGGYHLARPLVEHTLAAVGE